VAFLLAISLRTQHLAILIPRSPADFVKDAKSRECTSFVLTCDHARLPKRRSSDFRSAHVDSSAAGVLVNCGAFDSGALKGKGRARVQVLVSTSCALALAKRCTSKIPIGACVLLYGCVPLV
jgi:hypothetical protein